MLTCSDIARIFATGDLAETSSSWLEPSLRQVAEGRIAAALEQLEGVDMEAGGAGLVIYLRCRCLLNLSQPEAVAELLQRQGGALEPADRLKLQARLLISTGQAQQAAPLLLHYLQANSLDWEALALAAALGTPQSEELYAQALQLQPGQADALRNRAALRLQQGRLDEAIADLRQALRWRPTFTPALELLHQPLLQIGEVQTLAGYYRDLPDWAWSARLTGLYLGVLRNLGKADEAWQLAQHALKRWPIATDLLLSAAAAAQATGQPGAARQLYQQLQRIGPAPVAALALNNLALLAVADDNLPDALELIREACRLDPHNGDVQLHLAELLLRKGEQEEAETKLQELHRQLKSLNPAQQRRWLLAQSRLLQRKGELEQALAMGQEARRQWPGLADTWLQEAAILADLQRVDEGITLIQQAADQVDQPKELRDALLRYVLQQGRLEQASQLLEQWLQQAPGDVGLLSQKAGLLIDLGQFQAAEDQLRSLAYQAPQRGGISLIKFLLQRNRPAEALAVCEQLISIDSQRLVPYQLGAQALVQQERWRDAIAMLESARRQDPDRLDVLSDLIRLMLQQGDGAAAMAALETEMARQPRLPLLRLALQVLQQTQGWTRGFALLAPLEQADPGNTEVQQLKIRLFRRQGQLDVALALSAKLVAAHPTNLRLRESHIRELLLQEHFEAAQQQAHALADQLPDSPQRLLQLVALLKLADAPEQALAELQTQMARWPANPELPWREIELLDQLSRTTEAQRRLEGLINNLPSPNAQLLERACATSLRHRMYEAALGYTQQWHQLQPSNVRALWQGFEVLSQQNRLGEAQAMLDQIRQRNPHERRLDPAEASILIKKSRNESATRLLDRAIELDPTNQALKDQRLMARTSAGDFNSFDAELAELDRLRGEARHKAHSQYFFNINCHPTWNAQRVYAFYRDWYEKAIAPDLPPIPSYPSSQFDPNKRLKIGYVSGDFKTHAVAYFSEPLLMEHDRKNFEIYAFSTHSPAESSATTERFRSYMHHWIDVYGMNDSELFRKIRKLGIDILVDLSGHTDGSRIMVFARKPAPLQLSAVFGAGQTTGLFRIDYLLCDQVSTPAEHAPYLSEQRAELPFAGLPYKPGDDFIDPASLPSLTGAPFTFACVTRPVRVNTAVCALWGQILKACPQAQLVFEHGSYEEPEVQERFRHQLAAGGARVEQILFRNTRPYWQLFHGIDLLLDPWPAGSGTVGTDALWMERLTLTLTSRPIMGRGMTAQLTGLGLAKGFVCSDLESYRLRAIALATSASGRAELAEASTGLRQRLQNSHLMNYKSYGQAAAQLYRRLWIERCCAAAHPPTSQAL